jgi:hypothetical protein
MMVPKLKYPEQSEKFGGIRINWFIPWLFQDGCEN